MALDAILVAGIKGKVYVTGGTLKEKEGRGRRAILLGTLGGGKPYREVKRMAGDKEEEEED